MSRYWYKLRFLIGENHRLKYEGNSCEFQLSSNEKVTLQSVKKDQPLIEATLLDFISREFEVEEEAFKSARRLQNSALLAGTRILLPLSLGFDGDLDSEQKILIRNARERSESTVTATPGIHLMDNSIKGHVKFMDGKLTSLPELELFLEVTKEAFSKQPKLSNEQILALELYALTKFESNVRARFITLATVVEVLAPEIKRTNVEIKFLSEFNKQIKSFEMDEEVKQSLIKGIASIKNKSLTDKCKSFVSTVIDDQAAEDFHGFYKIRHKIVHSGFGIDNATIVEEYSSFENLVIGVLFKSVMGNTGLSDAFNRFHGKRKK